MANTADAVTGNAVYGLKAYSLKVVSTLLNSCVVLAILGLMNSNKGNELYGVGSPEAGMLLSGADIDPIRKKEIVECAAYYPDVKYYDQRDIKTMGYRDTSATMSTSAGTATYTATIASGVITAVTVGGTNTGFSGTPPTLIAVDAGYTGAGAILEGTISGGAITVTVISGGYGYSSSVTILENSGKTEAEKTLRPCFKWTHKETPVYVWKRDLDRFEALRKNQKQLFDAGVNELTARSQLAAVSSLLQYVNQDVIYGSPNTLGADTDDLWKNQFGLVNAFAPDNTYAGIDRTLTANWAWRGRRDDTSHVYSLEDLYADMHFTKGISYLGGSVDALLVGPTLFTKYQREIAAYRTNPDPDGKIAKLRTFGWKGQAINYNGMFVVSDNRIAAKSAFGIDARSLIFATKSGYNFKMSELKDQSLIEGGKQAFYGTADLQYMLVCEGPMLNVYYTALT